MLGMRLNEETIESPPRPAASLLMLRDVPATSGGTQMEVFLMKRHSNSKVLGGAYVFPGGKLDPDDMQVVLSEQLLQSKDDLHQHLQEPDQTLEGAAALYVAALREAFEECGVLFAKHQHAHEGLDFSKSTQELAKQLLEGVSFSKALKALNLLLDTKALWPWARWITPKTPTVSNQRFDARFFVGVMPSGQEAQHDNVEATHSVWITPQSALQSYCKQEIELAAPQIMSLLGLSEFSTSQEVLARARGQRPVKIEPHSTSIEGVRAVCFPGDALHPVTEKLLYGPTRLWFKDGRFEPSEGIDRLLMNF